MFLPWRKNPKPQYDSLPDTDSSDHLLSPDVEKSPRSKPASKHVPSQAPAAPSGPSWLITTALVLIAATASALLGAWSVTSQQSSKDATCIQHTSQYSPLLSDIPITYNPTRFNGSLLAASIFRQDAGPEVDAAWKTLGADYRAVRVPVTEAARANLAPDQVHIQEKYGGGFPAHVEGLHHLHCLNLLRKSLSWNFEYYLQQGLGPFSNDGIILKHHVTHCLDILRQQLMCTVDIGVLGQVWYRPAEQDAAEPFVDFNTLHTCRNFEDVRRWAEKHQLPDGMEVPGDFLAQPGPGDRVWEVVP